MKHFNPLILFQQKHPHVIFEARAKQNKGCANSGNLDWRKNPRKTKHVSELIEEAETILGLRYRRDSNFSHKEKLFSLNRTKYKKFNESGGTGNYDNKNDDENFNNDDDDNEDVGVDVDGDGDGDDDGVYKKNDKEYKTGNDYYSKIENNKKFEKFVLKNVFQQNVRYKRDVREATKYVETALVLDKAMVSFSKFFFFVLEKKKEKKGKHHSIEKLKVVMKKKKTISVQFFLFFW